MWIFQNTIRSHGNAAARAIMKAHTDLVRDQHIAPPAFYSISQCTKTEVRITSGDWWAKERTNNWMAKHASAWKSVIKVDIVLQYSGSSTSSSITAKLLLLCQILRKEKFVNDCSLRAAMVSVQTYWFSHLISKGISFHKCVFMRNVLEKNLQSEELPCSEMQDRCYNALFTAE